MSEMLDITIVKQIQAAYKAGYDKCLQDRGELSKYISRNEAHKIYGRRTVDRWADEGLITIIKDGEKNCRCRILREEIELVAGMSNRSSWYKHNVAVEG